MRGLLALLLMTTPVLAHDWFTSLKDPVNGNVCCGGSDCKEIPDSMLGTIELTAKGYMVTLTPEQIRIIAPGDGYEGTIHELISFDRVQPSRTGRFAACVVYDKVRCFFAP